MQPLLFLSHRIPFPPNKGDKVRSFNLLRHLTRHYRVHLGTFVDDPADWAHVGALRELVADLFVARLDRRIARLRSVGGLARGEALTLPFYRHRRLQDWVGATIGRHAIERVVVFSSAMEQYVPRRAGLRLVTDFVDVDSDKWRQYASGRSGPSRWVYSRESRRLLEHERHVARRSHASLFVSEAEAELFRALAPESAGRTHGVANGVDVEYFSPDPARGSPFPADVVPIVFTGAMDYWPNVDAVQWFAEGMLDAIRARLPQARFYIVGMNPTSAVQSLARAGVVEVSGRVPDIRPYLQHARVVVAPLRIARGIQNKVLEAMAMARPVVATATCSASLGARAGHEMEQADEPAAFVEHVLACAEPSRGEAIGRAARAFVRERYGWAANLDPLVALIEGHDVRPAARAAAVPGAADRADALKAVAP